MSTYRAEHRFVVKDFESGRLWISFELMRGKDLPNVGDGFLGFDLKEGITLDEAKRLADTLNDMITHTSYTK